MKFLCLDCDEAMKLLRAEGPDEGSLAVTFRCPTCGFRVAMLTNPFETQLVQSLGVKVGPSGPAPKPFERVRASLAQSRFEPTAAGRAGGAPGTTDEHGEAAANAEGPGCPFAAMVNEPTTMAEAGFPWTREAESRLDRIPSFIRPMAKKAIERYAEGHGHGTITEAVMDEARGAMGM